MNDTISIIVPTLNEKENIQEFMKHILNQKIRPDELIFIDSSNDGTYELLKEYEKKNNFIKVFRSDKKGTCYALNIGIENSKGKYILKSDADWRFIQNDIFEILKQTIKEDDYDRITMTYLLDIKKVFPDLLKRLIAYRDMPRGQGFSIYKRKIVPLFKEGLAFGEDRFWLRECNSKVKKSKLIKNIQFTRTGINFGLKKFIRRYIWYGRTIWPYLKMSKDNKTLLGTLVYITSPILLPLQIIPFLRGFVYGSRYFKYDLIAPLALGFLEVLTAYCMLYGTIQYFLGNKELGRVI